MIKNLTRGKIYNSNSKTLKILEAGNGILCIGKKAGKSEVKTQISQYTIHVLTQNDFNSFTKLKLLTKKILGLDVQIQQEKVEIQGEILRFSDWKKIADHAEAKNLQYVLNAKVSKETSVRVLKLLEDQFNNLLLTKPKLIFGSQPIAIISDVKNEKIYKKILNPWGIPVQVNESAVEIEPIIGINILVAELRKSTFNRIGIRWPTSYQSQILPKLSATDALAISAEAIEQQGLGQVLASPHILCRSGKQASFLAGGEIPIRVATYKTSQVIWKKYGVLLNVKPKADFSGRMSIEIDTEVSNIDPSQTAEGIPGFITHQMKTHFDLEKTQTIVLSGLIKTDYSTTKEGLPFLLNIPILGKLFSSEEYRNSKTELVIMVTPTVVGPSNEP